MAKSIRLKPFVEIDTTTHHRWWHENRVATRGYCGGCCDCCDACLNDEHYCEECNDFVSHGHDCSHDDQ